MQGCVRGTRSVRVQDVQGCVKDARVGTRCARGVRVGLKCGRVDVRGVRAV